jgi:hypothetical protein
MSGGIPSGDQISGAVLGPASQVTPMDVGSAGVEYAMPSTPDKAAFNGGRAVEQQVDYDPQGGGFFKFWIDTQRPFMLVLGLPRGALQSL